MPSAHERYNRAHDDWLEAFYLNLKAPTKKHVAELESRRIAMCEAAADRLQDKITEREGQITQDWKARAKVTTK